jgi:hypothetical protein
MFQLNIIIEHHKQMNLFRFSYVEYDFDYKYITYEYIIQHVYIIFIHKNNKYILHIRY